MSWRCPLWQSRHCCHLPGILTTTWRRVSCVTFAISKAVNVRESVSKNLSFQIPPIKNLNYLKNVILQEIANVTQGTLRRVMASVHGRCQQCLDCHGGHLQDVALKTWGFLWIQDTDLLDRFQLYLLLCTIKFYPTFKMGNVKCRTLYIYIYIYKEDKFP